MDRGRKLYLNEELGMVVAASPQIYMGDARRSLDSRFPVLNFPNIVRLTANDKDFSLALEMTTRESPMSPSLLVS